MSERRAAKVRLTSRRQAWVRAFDEADGPIDVEEAFDQLRAAGETVSRSSLDSLPPRHAARSTCAAPTAPRPAAKDAAGRGRRNQKTRIGIWAGAASRASSSASSFSMVREAPAISSEVQYSPT